MFALAVHYLTGRAAGARFDSRAHADWPPDSAKLFYALVNALHATGNRADERAALLWLETQAPPAMWFSDAATRDQFNTYVPRNDDDSLAEPEDRRRRPRSFPSVCPERPIVYYIWANADLAPGIRQSLIRLLRTVTYLGHSSSFVVVTICDEPPTPNWVPAPTGELSLRIVGPGTVTELEQIHDIYIQAVAYGARLKGERARRWEPSLPQLPASFANYARVGVNTATRPPDYDREFCELLVFGLPPGCPLPVLSTLAVTNALRGAAMAHAKPQPVEALTGHSRDGKPSQRSHAAFLTLPDVAHDFADGHLLGLAVALPRLDNVSRLAVLRSIAPIDRLRLGRAGAWDIDEVRPGTRTRRGLELATWVKPSRHWATITPIALYPRRRRMTEEHVVQACLNGGLPEPTEIVISHYSPLIGVPPSPSFARIYLRQRGGMLWQNHAILSFDRPVPGPVIIGAGRFKGYGLCRPFYPSATPPHLEIRER